jgi:DMSO/TMAO reductase YedYZ heme-binding membrane subunit
MTATRARHAAPKHQQRVPGPVTGALKVIRLSEPKPLAFLLRAWPAVPPLFLIFPFLHRGDTGHYAGVILGLDATLCLVACIAVTPLITLARIKATRYRMIYGVWMFTIGALGLAVTVLLDHPLVMAVAGDSVQWTGTALILLLLPMTVTSNAACQRLLGPEWKRWQRSLLWAVYVLVLVHLAALRSYEALTGFSLATLPMILLRWPRVRQSVKAWRASRYEGGRWWAGLAVIFTAWLAGLVILVTLIGVACASAVNQ